MVIHESAEDYLESILALQEQMGEGQVHSIDIVNRLGYSKPSVSIAMKKLRENGYISMSGDGSITLRESGRPPRTGIPAFRGSSLPVFHRVRRT